MPPHLHQSHEVPSTPTVLTLYSTTTENAMTLQIICRRQGDRGGRLLA